MQQHHKYYINLGEKMLCNRESISRENLCLLISLRSNITDTVLFCHCSPYQPAQI